MAEVKDGGPAFPTEPHWSKQGDTQYFYQGQYGMSLRDWFAGQAMIGSLPKVQDGKYDDAAMRLVEAAAFMAYRVADAMLKARGEH